MQDINKIISLAKRRGFIFQSSDIYGGMANAFDFGALGVELKNNIKKEWWKMFVHKREDITGLDASIIMNSKVWEASGHIDEFHDPLVEDVKTKQRYRADHLLEDAGVDIAGMSVEEMNKAVKENNIKSPKGNEVSDVREFNLLFETYIGTVKGEKDIAYLRPETAQAMFVNFNNTVSSISPSLPFGIAQIGKAFRNEITPRNYIFRTREFEQMEIEYFVREDEWEKYFEEWVVRMDKWLESIGVDKSRIHHTEIPDGERAHYSKRTIDFEYDFPFGKKELYGLAYRGDYDLQQHIKHSGEKIFILDSSTNEKIVPHTIEPTFGVERTMLAIMLEAYTEEDVEGDTRVVMKFKPSLAPYKIAVFPLIAKDEKIEKMARNIFEGLVDEGIVAMYDKKGAIGKRYRKQDEAGTPLCATVDNQSLEDKTVTLRDRDTMKQVRIKDTDIKNFVNDVLKGKEFNDLISVYGI